MNSNHFEMLNATITADGNTIQFPIERGSMLALSAACSTGSGTITDFTLWLQGRDKEGENWVDVPADLALKTVDAAAGGTVNTNVRDIIDGKATTTAENYTAIYKHLPFEEIRLKYTMSGSTPSLPVRVTAAAK